MNDVTHHDDDDGYSGSLVNNRLIKGQLLKWNETKGWFDRDGLQPPEILLAFAVTEALQCWKDKKPVETITAKPLPDIIELNAALPKDEWEPGLDGKPKAPWSHQYVVYLLDPASGGFFTYLNSTTGARIAYEQLHEKVITMRALRGARVVPVVRLTHRPMKTFVGMKTRPEFEIVGWKLMGDNGGGSLAEPQAPQLTSGPAGTATAPEEPNLEPKKKASSAADATLGAMENVSEPTMSELLDDEINF